MLGKKFFFDVDKKEKKHERVFRCTYALKKKYTC